MASVVYVLHLTIPVDMYFISVSAIKALCSLCSFPHFDNFLNGDSFLCSLATKFNMHAEKDNLSPQKAPGVSPQTNVI